MPTTVRPATAADHALYLRLLPLLGVDDPPPSLETWLRAGYPETIVAERGGTAVGLCWWQSLEGSGYVRQLIVATEAQRLGVGRQLLEHVRARLKSSGATKWALNVKPENAAAIALYESLGMRRAYRGISLKVPFEAVGRLPVRNDVVIETVTPEGDAAAERSFSLPPGQLANFRATGRTLLLARTPTEPFAALAAFNPGFPGAFPFRVRDLTVLGALLGVMRDGATRRDGGALSVSAEDHPALAAELEGVGATVRMIFDHYEGAV
ncbi:MAG: GNAT family N-acetyltransferase [Myxococcaceae bacterium]